MISEAVYLTTSPATMAVPDPSYRGSWYEFDLGAVRHNYRQLRASLPPGVHIYACLKRNGYGCGAAEMAAALTDEGVDGFAVAALPDALAIRRKGLNRPILLYPGAPFSAGPLIERHDLTVTLSSLCDLHEWRKTMKAVSAFVKLDLGFYRAGVTPANAIPLLRSASDCENVRVKGIYAHLSELPSAAGAGPCDQHARMLAVLREAERLGLRPPIAMMSSTDGVLQHPEMDLDAVDPGALLVGLADCEGAARPLALRPALKAIATRLVAVKELDASLGPLPAGLGFHEGMRLGVIGFGWGDGFPRDVPPNAQAIIRGHRVPLLPPAHLEHLRLDLSKIPSASVGDPVLLLGRQGEEEITLEELAVCWKTDRVAIHAALRDHVPRIYL